MADYRPYGLALSQTGTSVYGRSEPFHPAPWRPDETPAGRSDMPVSAWARSVAQTRGGGDAGR